MPVLQEGNSPRCLMDFWAQRCLEEIKEAAEQQVPPHQHTTDRAMADTIMDFLFASQDATTAAVVWVTVLMADYPDVLQKVCVYVCVCVSCCLCVSRVCFVMESCIGCTVLGFLCCHDLCTLCVVVASQVDGTSALFALTWYRWARCLPTFVFRQYLVGT